MSRWSSTGPHCRTDTGHWADLMAEVDWMFRSAGLDTAEIAEHLDTHEAVVSRALSHARAARRQPDGGASHAI